MSIASVLTGGLGNGTFSGSPALLVTDGYSIGEEVVPPAVIAGSTLKLNAEDRTIKLGAENRTLILSVKTKTLKV